MNRSKRAAQLSGRLLLTEPIEIAQDKRLAEGLRQRSQLVVEGCPIFAAVHRGEIRCDRMPGCSHFSPSALALAPACRSDSHVGRDPKCHAVQPASQRFAAADCSGPFCQDEERRLGGVLGVLFIAKNLAADPQDHGCVPVDEGCKRGFGILAPALEELFEQLPVGQAAGGAGVEEGFDLLDEFHRWPAG